MTTMNTDISSRLAAALTLPHRPRTGLLVGLRRHLQAVRHQRWLQNLSQHQLRDIGLTDADIAVLRAASAPLIR